MRMKYKNFDEYLYEIEIYSTRSERLMAELNHDQAKHEQMVAWLRAAFESARTVEIHQYPNEER